MQCFCVDPGEDSGMLKHAPVSKFSTARTLPNCILSCPEARSEGVRVCVCAFVCMRATLTAIRKKEVLAHACLLQACFSLVVTKFLSVTCQREKVGTVT